MKLRWLVFINPDGSKDEPILQYCDNEIDYWKDVPIAIITLKFPENLD